MKTLLQWLEYIEQAHNQEIDMGLSRIQKVAAQLSLNFNNKLVISVAGTNGKGSTCRFIEQALVTSNISVGVYSSPHIIKFNERIRVNGKDVTDQSICHAFGCIKSAADRADNGGKISLTYFEYATLAALLLFQECSVDVCILEVGLGGRLDATNIIDADIGVITSIALDHQEYLGNTLNEIAAEKAGIIKPYQAVVIGFDSPQQSLLDHINEDNVLLKKGREFDVNLQTHSSRVTGNFSTDDIQISLDLSNSLIPQQNIMTAIATLVLISKSLNQKSILGTKTLLDSDFLQNLVCRVSMPGRFEICRKDPLVVLDVAHNEAAAKLVVKQVKKLNYDRCFIIVGMLRDKNIKETIQVLSGLNPVWFCSDLPSTRSANKDMLATHIEALGQTVSTHTSIKLAYKSVMKQASADDLVLVVGSFVVASEFKLQYEQLKG